MKVRAVLGALFMILSLLSGSARASAEDEFWKWFQSNEARLYTFESNREAVFDELAKKINAVNRDLTFEFSSVKKDGCREFVISAGG
jgi:hypothetical protein